MATSSPVVAGTNATASEQNNLRTDAIRRDSVFQFEIEDLLAAGDNQGGTWLIPAAFTVTKVKVWCEVGTCTVRIKKNSTNILASQAVTTTPTDITVGFGTSALAENDQLINDILTVSSAEHLIVQVHATRNI
jgi:hypothetical protein